MTLATDLASIADGVIEKSDEWPEIKRHYDWIHEQLLNAANNGQYYYESDQITQVYIRRVLIMQGFEIEDVQDDTEPDLPIKTLIIW